MNDEQKPCPKCGRLEALAEIQIAEAEHADDERQAPKEWAFAIGARAVDDLMALYPVNAAHVYLGGSSITWEPEFNVKPKEWW